MSHATARRAPAPDAALPPDFDAAVNALLLELRPLLRHVATKCDRSSADLHAEASVMAQGCVYTAAAVAGYVPGAAFDWSSVHAAALLEMRHLLTGHGSDYHTINVKGRRRRRDTSPVEEFRWTAWRNSGVSRADYCGFNHRFETSDDTFDAPDTTRDAQLAELVERVTALVGPEDTRLLVERFMNDRTESEIATALLHDGGITAPTRQQIRSKRNYVAKRVERAKQRCATLLDRRFAAIAQETV